MACMWLKNRRQLQSDHSFPTLRHDASTIQISCTHEIRHQKATYDRSLLLWISPNDPYRCLELSPTLFGDLERRCRQFSHGLREAGVERKDDLGNSRAQIFVVRPAHIQRPLVRGIIVGAVPEVNGNRTVRNRNAHRCVEEAGGGGGVGVGGCGSSAL